MCGKEGSPAIFFPLSFFFFNRVSIYNCTCASGSCGTEFGAAGKAAHPSLSRAEIPPTLLGSTTPAATALVEHADPMRLTAKSPSHIICLRHTSSGLSVWPPARCPAPRLPQPRPRGQSLPRRAPGSAAETASRRLSGHAARPAGQELHFPRAAAPRGDAIGQSPSPIGGDEVGSGAAGAGGRAGRLGEHGAGYQGTAAAAAPAGRELPPPPAGAAPPPLRPARGRTEKEGGRNVRFFRHRAPLRVWGCPAALSPPRQRPRVPAAPPSARRPSPCLPRSPPAAAAGRPSPAPPAPLPPLP